MTDDLAIRLARVQAMAAGAIVKCAAMVAENEVRREAGHEPAHSPTAFFALLDEYGLHWNTIVGDTRP